MRVTAIGGDRRRTWRRGPGPWLAAAVVLLLGVPATTRAQDRPPSALALGAGAEVQLLVGAELIDGGIGPGVTLDWPPTESPLFRVTADASLSPLDDDTDGLTGARADNTVWTMVAGPELAVPLWRLEPHVGALGGVMMTAWSVEGRSRERDGGSLTAVWGGQAGLDVRLLGGRYPVSLTTNFRILDGGELEFARAHPLVGEPGPGSVRSENVSALAVRAGLRVGIVPVR